ncbi:MAG: helix-turn-helix transcriptional regulator, partial [Planctomycetota bacterium]
EIRKTSDQVLTFGEGVIYPMLHSLEKKKYLGTRRVMVNGRPRIYYRVTARGKKQLATSIAQWQRVTHAVQQVLEGVRGEAAMP